MKSILITGANSGIGLEFCRQYKEKGWDVYAVCRTLSEDLKELKVRVLSSIDFADKNSFDKISQFIGQIKLDILINNAGVAKSSSLDNMREEDFLYLFKINAFTPLRLTQSLLPCLTENSSKVIMISSRMASISDNHSGGSYAYRMSKAALNAASQSLACDLYSKGIALGLFHPGYVKTKMTSYSGYIETNESVSGMISQIENLSLSKKN